MKNILQSPPFPPDIVVWSGGAAHNTSVLINSLEKLTWNIHKILSYVCLTTSYWPMTRGTLWILFTSSWAWRNSFFKFLCSSFKKVKIKKLLKIIKIPQTHLNVVLLHPEKLQLLLQPLVLDVQVVRVQLVVVVAAGGGRAGTSLGEGKYSFKKSAKSENFIFQN